MTKNIVRMVWVHKQVIVCWFVTFGSFRAQRPELLAGIFLNRIDRIQQRNGENYVQKIWVKIVVICDWFLFLAGFRI